MRKIFLLLAAVVPALLPRPAAAQGMDAAEWAVRLSSLFRVVPDVTYLTAGGHESKLDVYTPSGQRAPVPTVIFFHGGGWIRGTKEQPVLHTFPYLQMGWAVVNVEYRMAPVALAPAAVEDGRCALRWVWRNAREYGFDTTRIVVTGHSAGGHLALTTGMLPEEAGLDRACPGPEHPRVAAIVDWYGITDVADVLEGPNQESWAVQWVGTRPDREEVARRVSPLAYVRPGLPPILMIHGDADPTVPYSHSVRLHQALDRAGVPNRLLTIPGAKHGGLSQAQLLDAYAVVRDFLARQGLTPAQGGAGSR